jgi:hypothetical protein
MPVRSLNTSVLAWPTKEKIDTSLDAWARDCADSISGLLAIGYIGSYARGDWGVGSDLDLILILDGSGIPFIDRPLDFDTTSLPVPVDMFVYTRGELSALMARGGRFAKTLRREIKWVWRHKDFRDLQV